MLLRLIVGSLSLILLTANCAAGSVDLIPIGSTCSSKNECVRRDAIIFIHGIYGGRTTFHNGDFKWPEELKEELGVDGVDVYLVRYKTSLFAWLRKNIASLDEIVDELFTKLHGNHLQARFGITEDKPYRSIGIIAHSLGGNVAGAYLHYVKSELGMLLGQSIHSLLHSEHR